MDPITVLLSALSLASSAAGPIRDQAVKDGYAALKAMILRKFGGKDPMLEPMLAKYADKPDSWKGSAHEVLREAGIDKDQDIVDHATDLLTKAEAAQPGATGGLVGQISAQGGRVNVIHGDVHGGLYMGDIHGQLPRQP